MRLRYLLTILPFLISCSVVPYSFKGYRVGETDVKTVGSVLLNEEWGVESNGVRSGDRIELIFLGLEDSALCLLYREFSTSENAKYIKPAFTQS